MSDARIDAGDARFDELVRYWLGELSEAHAEQLEAQLFEDASLARQWETIARLGRALETLVVRGQVEHVLAVGGLERLGARGVAIRQYEVAPGGTAPCSVDLEDFVAIRLKEVLTGSAGPPQGVQHVDVEMEARAKGAAPLHERYPDVPVDRRTREVVLMYPGDRIRALPATQVRYRVFAHTPGGRVQLGEYQLDHQPSRWSRVPPIQ